MTVPDPSYAPTLEDAHAIIGRVKARREECDECARIGCQALFHVVSGSPGELPGLNEALQAAAVAHLTEYDWEPVPYSEMVIKRCDACAPKFMFPWAHRLDAEKVLAYMVAHPQPFFVADLEQTL